MTEDVDLCPSGCGRVQKPGKLLCSTCWREVPLELQRDVYQTWRAYQRIRGNPRRNGKATAIAAYRAARDAAIGSIR